MPRGIGYTPLAPLPSSSSALRNQIALQLIGRQQAPANVGQGFHSIGQSLATALIAKRLGAAQDEQQAALGEALFGRSNLPEGAPRAAEGVPVVDRPGGPSLGPASTPGALSGSGVTPQQAQALMLLPGGRERLAGMVAPEPPEPDPTSTVKDMIAFGLDPSNPADQERYFELSGRRGTTVNVGGLEDPVTGSQGPGAQEDLASAAGQIVTPDGQVNRALVTAMNIPGGGGLAPAAAQLDGAISTVAEFRGISLDEAREIYRPGLTDSDDTIRNKINRLSRDLSRATGEARRGQAEGPAPIPAAVPEGGEAPSSFDQVLDFVQGLFRGEEEPAAATSTMPAAQEGDVIRNRRTGERRILRNGQWVPFDG